jgi:uncharacterized membrane protein YkvA (DUF1232 family)
MLRLLRFWRLGGADLRLIWFALRHSKRPVWLWPAVIALGWFALEPLNFAFPLLGVADDLILLPLLLYALVRFLPNQIRVDYVGRGGVLRDVPAARPKPP